MLVERSAVCVCGEIYAGRVLGITLVEKYLLGARYSRLHFHFIRDITYGVSAEICAGC